MADEHSEVQTGELAGRRVTVMGLGRFGGGAGAVRFLLEQGAQVTLTDLQTADELADSLRGIACDQLAQLVLGEHRESDFTQADLIVVNPAVKPDNPFVALARAQGIPVTTEVGLFWERCPARKLVVTGSTGKSTTAALIQACLRSAGQTAHLGGNIGGSLLSQLPDCHPQDWVILELSSFQLALLEPLQPRPDVAVVTNFFPNHLDWHGSLDAYREAKQNAICWQSADDVAVLNADDADSPLWPTSAQVIWYGQNCWRDRPGVLVDGHRLVVRTKTQGWTLEESDLAPSLRTPQGRQNTAAALAAVTVGIGIPLDQVAAALLNFAGLPHRLQTVGTLSGRTVIDDSKATTPEAAIAALQSVSQPVVLIAGGKNKGADLLPWAEEIARRVKAVALIGDTAPALAQALAERAGPLRSDPHSWIHLAPNLPAAAAWIWEHSVPGDAVLLSPGCASHAEFANFIERGRCFVQSVQTLSGGDPAA